MYSVHVTFPNLLSGCCIIPNIPLHHSPFLVSPSLQQTSCCFSMFIYFLQWTSAFHSLLVSRVRVIMCNMRPLVSGVLRLIQMTMQSLINSSPAIILPPQGLWREPPCLPDSRLHGCQPWKHCSLSMCIRHTGLGVWHSLQDNTSKSLHCPKKMFLTSCHSFRVQTQCVTSRNLIKYAVGCIGNFLLSSLFLRSI